MSRVKYLTRLWTDYNNLWNRKEAKSHSLGEPSLPPAEPPKQAIHNLKRGSRWFFVFQKSLSGRAAQRNGGKTATLSRPDASGLPIERQEDQDDHRIVEAIPKNTPGERPIKPEKLRKRL